jgi:hypothetical protein
VASRLGVLAGEGEGEGVLVGAFGTIYMELTTAGRRRPEGKGYDPFQQKGPRQNNTPDKLVELDCLAFRPQYIITLSNNRICLVTTVKSLKIRYVLAV